MTKAYPVVPLSEIAEAISRPVSVTAGESYRTIGVKWWGEGAYERETIDGSRTAAKTLSLVREGDLIINKIWVRHGSTAIAAKAVDGCAASGDFWTKCDALSRGTSGKNRIKPELFLTIEIPLPTLEVQRRVVARIEELSAKIQEARNLRQNSTEDTGALIASEEMTIWPDEMLRTASTLGQITRYLSRGRQSRQGLSDHLLIKTQHVQMGRYVPTEMRLDPYVATKVHDEALVRGGDILIACSAAGCLGRVAFYTDTTDRMISTDTHVAIARAEQELVLPEYLYAYLKGAQGQIQLRSREKGDWTREKIGFRLTELNVADMRRVPVPVLPIKEQRRIVSYLDDLQAKADGLKKLQADSAAELEALLPSILSKAFSGAL